MNKIYINSLEFASDNKTAKDIAIINHTIVLPMPEKWYGMSLTHIMSEAYTIINCLSDSK